MNTTVNPDQQAERLEAATAAAREVLGELNSAGKDLRATIKDARALLAEHTWQGEVRAQMTALAAVLDTRMREASENVLDEFKRLGDILLAVDRAEPLEHMVREVAAHPGQRRVASFKETLKFDVDPLDVR